MKWIGYWMIVVAALHLAAAFAFYGDSYLSIASDGFWASGSTDATKLAFWFVIASPFMFLVGLLVLNMQSIPFSAGVTLTIIAVTGAIVIPASGFWLVIPPAMAMLFIDLKQRRA